MRILLLLVTCALLLPALTGGEEPVATSAITVPTALENVPAADAALLEAARIANQVYQHHLFALRQKLAGDDEAGRLEAMLVMSRLADRSLIQDLLPFLQQDVHTTAEVRTAITALANIGSQEVVAEFRRLSALQDETIRAAAICGLARMEALGINDFRVHVDNPAEAIKTDAVVGIGENRDTQTGAKLVEALRGDPRPFIRQRAAIALGELGERANGPHLAEALTDANPRVRRLAAEALVLLDYKPAIPKLIMALEANVAGLHINRCLIRLTGQDFKFNPQGGAVEQMNAIEAYFVWWTDNADALGQ